MNLEESLYVEDPGDNDAPSFSEDDYKKEIESKSEGEMSEEEMSLREKIDQDIENEFKKKNALKQGIPKEALTNEVENAELLHQIDSKKLEILKSLKKEKEKTKKNKKGPLLGSFFGF